MADDDLQTLLAHKREMFDAMRAYQQSEHTHKSDAITLLAAVLTVVGAVFAAIVLPDKALPHAGVLAGFAGLGATLGAWVIVSATNAKIDKDHERYAAFGAEYVRTCDVLGLYDAKSYGGATEHRIKDDRLVGQGKGYQATQAILAAVGWTVSGLAWLAMLFVWLAICPRSETQACSTPLADRPAQCARAEPAARR